MLVVISSTQFSLTSLSALVNSPSGSGFELCITVTFAGAVVAEIDIYSTNYVTCDLIHTILSYVSLKSVGVKLLGEIIFFST